jgi:hypothetical protein
MYYHQLYREKHSFQYIKNETDNIKLKHPNRVPILISVSQNDKSLFNLITNHKYMIPKDMTFTEFIQIIRHRIHLDSNEALFAILSEQNIMPKMSSLVGELYEKYKSNDGYLVITLTKENTFG